MGLIERLDKMEYEDPTAFHILFDPREQRMRGQTRQGNKWFDVPYMSHIKDNLWQGGCQGGLILPEFIKSWVQLYKWESYEINHELNHHICVTMHDTHVGWPDDDEIRMLAGLVLEWSKEGPVLASCQAGLNRSGMVAACALILDGMDNQEAIDLLRTSRSKAVLCNRTFEKFVLQFTP